MRRIALAVGGTGGHILPAIELAKNLRKKGVEVHFLGVLLENNSYLDRSFFYYSLAGSNRALVKMLKGIWQSFYYLRKNKIDLVVGFGSYHSLPPLTAAILLRVPFVLCEANLFPGRVNRLFAKKAKWTAVQFLEASSLIRSKIEWVDFLSEKFRAFAPSKRQAAAYFGLSETLPTLLVFGGSHGASRINNKIVEVIPLLSREFQVIHLIGKKESQKEIENVYQKNGISHVVKAFEHHMEYAYTLASFAITRAGASTLAELIHFQLPAIIIPYPFATDNHQLKNANYFVSTVEGGTLLEEKNLDELENSLELFFDTHFLSEKKAKLTAFPSEHRQRSLSDLLIQFS
jgi:UDP-N-acetylglucosamine--N-acetylmuramyl-(pentapeptide) pyrophosphoryl-undecaprenol N-acetylglucosamine transferase